MTSRERMQRAMSMEVPDRVPVMCQLSFGHLFLNAGVEPFDIWYTAEGMAKAMVRMQRKYHFDGILVNLPGRPPDIHKYIHSVERKTNGESIVHWKTGCYSVIPPDDNPHYYQPDGGRFFPSFEKVRPEELFYVEPWDVWDISYPPRFAFSSESPSDEDFFPPYHLDNLNAVRCEAGTDVSIHAEVFSPFSQLLELINYENALVALADDPGKVHACLERLTEGAITLGISYAGWGADAILVSSAFAGAGFISREHYSEFVLPYEKRLVQAIRARYDIPIYTHTCGKIRDRLDMMLETGIQGLDTLDPPPLGTVDLVEAKEILRDKVFIKGNIDSVNTLLHGTPSLVKEDVIRRLKIASPCGGYILSSACSVAPRVPPEHMEMLVPLAEEFGRYNLNEMTQHG